MPRTTNPASLTPDDLGALADHLHTLTASEVGAKAKQLRAELAA